jgi:hypothetical protein
VLASGPAAAGWGSEETEVWAIHEDGRLYDRYWDGTSWHQWETLGAPPGVRLVGQPAAAAQDAERIDVIAPGDDGKLWHRWWDGRGWVPWREIDGAPRGVTSVAADWVGSRLDVYVRDAERALWYIALRDPGFPSSEGGPP